MRERRVRPTWPAWAVLFALAAPLPAQEAPSKLAGRWQLNVKESESPELKFFVTPDGSGASPSPGTGGQSPGSGWGGSRPTPPPPPRPGPKPSPGARLAELEGALPPAFHDFLKPATTLAIEVSGQELTFDAGGGAITKLVADGSERNEGPLWRLARFEGGSLVVERWNDRGERLITRYNLMAGARKLEVYSRLAIPQRRALTLRRVYDEPPPDAEASPPPDTEASPPPSQPERDGEPS